MKNKNTRTLLTKLLNLFFNNHKVPDVWLQSLLYPIPKSPAKEPWIPLNNYRGISPHSVISKLYTGKQWYCKWTKRLSCGHILLRQHFYITQPTQSSKWIQWTCFLCIHWFKTKHSSSWIDISFFRDFEILVFLANFNMQSEPCIKSPKVTSN